MPISDKPDITSTRSTTPPKAMFTGIISAIGCIIHIGCSSQKLSEHSTYTDTQAQGDKRLCIQTPVGYLDDVALGDSIALNGACMTVVEIATPQKDRLPCFWVDISAESLSKTTGLNSLSARVNLEKALRMGDALGGHIVSGHVDGIARVVHFAPVDTANHSSWQLRIQAPAALAPYFAYKGSVAVNGVSLTVNQVIDNANTCTIAINLVAHTLSHTTLGSLRTGDWVNIEVDTIARYVARTLEQTKPATDG